MQRVQMILYFYSITTETLMPFMCNPKPTKPCKHDQRFGLRRFKAQRETKLFMEIFLPLIDLGAYVLWHQSKSL
jgi:hypothetical protein